MKPTLCSRCKKNLAVVFITKIDGGKTANEGLCLKCAKEMGIKPVDDMIERMGLSEDDLENLNGEMTEAMNGLESLLSQGHDAEDGSEDDEADSQTATFPFLNKLFGAAGQGQDNTPAVPEPEKTESRQRSGDKPNPKNKKHKFLDTYCQNLTQKARDGKLDRIIGREEETERVIQILNRRQKNNPCLIGEPGVGKTAIAEGLAQKIADKDVPYKLQNKEVYLMDLTALVAGTQFRGQFESRMKGLIEEVKKLGNIILVIDEVHNLVGAGDAEGSMNAANILKPALSRGEIQVIGATTFNEYRKHIEKDAALERRFQPVTVAEPTIEQSIAIIRGISLNEIEFRDLGRVVWKEIRVSVLCGVCLAIACFAKIIVVDMLLLKSESVTYLVAFVVCATMAVTVCLAKIVGSTLPLLAKKLGFDPAVMASPIITTIVDFLSLLVYFAFATAMLGIG